MTGGFHKEPKRHAITSYGAFSTKMPRKSNLPSNIAIVPYSEVQKNKSHRLNAEYYIDKQPDQLRFWLNQRYNKDKKWLEDTETLMMAIEFLNDYKWYIDTIRRYYENDRNIPIAEFYLNESKRQYNALNLYDEQKYAVSWLLLSLYKYIMKSKYKRNKARLEAMLIDVYKLNHNNKMPDKEFFNDLQKVIDDEMEMLDFIKKYNLILPRSITISFI